MNPQQLATATATATPTPSVTVPPSLSPEGAIWIAVVYSLAVAVAAVGPGLLDLIWGYVRSSQDRAPSGIQGLSRSTMALTVTLILGIAVIHTLIFGLPFADKEQSSLIINNLLSMLAATLAAIVGFYFGSRSQNAPATSEPLAILTTSLPDGRQNQLYQPQVLSASGGSPPYKWSVASGSGQLPAGLRLDAAGAIYGTPTDAPAEPKFRLRVEDSAGLAAEKDFTLKTV